VPALSNFHQLRDTTESSTFLWALNYVAGEASDGDQPNVAGQHEIASHMMPESMAGVAAYLQMKLLKFHMRKRLDGQDVVEADLDALLRDLRAFGRGFYAGWQVIRGKLKEAVNNAGAEDFPERILITEFISDSYFGDPRAFRDVSFLQKFPESTACFGRLEPYKYIWEGFGPNDWPNFDFPIDSDRRTLSDQEIAAFGRIVGPSIARFAAGLHNSIKGFEEWKTGL
jgi:hypothetical protein